MLKNSGVKGKKGMVIEKENTAVTLYKAVNKVIFRYFKLFRYL